MGDGENLENNQSTPKKKGRPRKIKETDDKIEVKIEKEKKKRGRKKKEDVVEDKKKKKRGRKATVKYFSSSIRKKIPLTTVVQDQNDYVLHFDIDIDTCNVNDKVNELHLESINTDIDNLKIDNEITKLEEVILNEDNKFTNIGKLEKADLDILYDSHILKREHQDIISKRFQKDDSVTFKSRFSKKIENDKQDRNFGFFKILQEFVDNKDWLQSTDCHCWWCCHQFKTMPIGIPVHYDKLSKKFRVKGVFCSFACMTMFNDNSKKPIENYIIKDLYNTLTGQSFSSIIKRAPPRECLKMFGGELDIEEFRENFKESKIYTKIEYPMYISRDYIEEIDIKNAKNANVNVFEDIFTINSNSIQQINDAKRRLQKQIDKTTVTKNTMDKFINFK